MVSWPPSPLALLAGLVLAAYAVGGAVVWHVEGRGRWRRVLTSRFVYGVPWGTLVVCALVLAVYLVVQGGLWHWNEPLVVPFRSWSYLYPTGVVLSSLSHASPNHLISNLTGALVLGPLAEYAWSHYPEAVADRAAEGRDRRLDEFAADGSGRSTVRGLRRAVERPWVRALVLFPAGVLAVGLGTSLFFLGPVVGFSGVVFALGGFALVRYPVATMVALLLAGVVRTTYGALLSPVVVRGVSGSAPSPPWWAEVAVQAHAVGVLVGVVLGLALLLARGGRPRAGRVFVAVLVYGVSRNLWAVYWIGDDGQYVLFRGVGVVLVVLLAVLVTVAAAASDRPITRSVRSVPGPFSGSTLAAGWLALLAVGVLALGAGATLLDWPLVPTAGSALVLAVALAVPAVVVLTSAGSTWDADESGAEAGTASASAAAPTARQVAFAVLVATTGILGGVAVYPNLVTVGEDAVPGEGAVVVEDYAVTYEEDVRNRMIPVVPLPGAEERTRTRTSGAIVVSQRRHVWTTALTRQYLASEGSGTVVVGGVGWRETVTVERSGWSVAGNGSTYVVDVAARGDRVRSFESPPRRAEPRVAGHNLTLAPAGDGSLAPADDGSAGDGFVVRATREGEVVDAARVPEAGESVRLGDVRVESSAEDGRASLYAVHDGTRVRIATREGYRQD